MTSFRRNAQGQAVLGGVVLSELLRDARVATPAYVYDLDAMREGSQSLKRAFGKAPHHLAYAVKANSAGSILRGFANEGLGADVVSGGELSLALRAGIPARSIVMSGVAKTDQEIDEALAADILAIQAESLEELDRIAGRARAAGRPARVALRINPSVEIDSHAHVRTGHDGAKFGIALEDASAAFARIDREPNLLLGVGLSTHVGSMIADTEPYLRSARKLAELARARRASCTSLEYINFGGGIGVDYGDRPCEAPERYVEAALGVLQEYGIADLQLMMEPGRALVAPYSVLLASVVQSKLSRSRRWLMLDAGMNDLIRPALYSAHHRIEPLDFPPGGLTYRIVGPVCESADDFGEHPIGDRVPESVAIREAGAYGFVMASVYNGRALPSEVFLAGGTVTHVSKGPSRDDWVKARLSA